MKQSWISRPSSFSSAFVQAGLLVVIGFAIWSYQMPNLDTIARLLNPHSAYQATVVLGGLLITYHLLQRLDQSWQINSR